MTALALSFTQRDILFIVNWWYVTIDPGYTEDTVWAMLGSSKFVIFMLNLEIHQTLLSKSHVLTSL
jgi:hypothetical protein